MKNVKELISKSKLLEERKWTVTLIKKYLTQPDGEFINPRGEKIKMYYISRVKSTEYSLPYRIDFSAIKLKEQVQREAIHQYYELLACINMQKTAIDQSPDFLNRFPAANILEALSFIEKDLRHIKLKTDLEKSLSKIRQNVYNKISELYPSFKQEYTAQMDQIILIQDRNGNNF